MIASQDAWKLRAGAWKSCELHKISLDDDLSVTLYSSIDFSPVNTSLYLKVLELVGLYKVDKTSDLGVLVTISDNDGD